MTLCGGGGGFGGFLILGGGGWNLAKRRPALFSAAMTVVCPNAVTG